jgi:cyclophilin family peptidyl-prolyl cis-trans isomerase
MVQNGVFNEARFFRVVPNFVVQWGIPADPAVAAKWRENGLKDEPVKQSNTQGMVTFAKSSAPNSRTTQMFINLRNNQNLDGMGFSPIGKIVEGFDVVQKINPEYGEAPNQGMIQAQGNEYLTKAFPNLDYIKSATIMEETAAAEAPAEEKKEDSAAE